MSQAAERVLDIIDAIAIADNPLTVMEVTAMTGLNKSTSSRLLKLLESREYVTREQTTKRYRIGPTLLGMLATIGKRTELLRVVHPHLETIRNESGETTSFHIRVGNERLCIDAVDRFPPQLHIQPLGIRSPLHIGTSGRVIIAFLEDASRTSILNLAAESGVEVGDLNTELAQIKARGYLVDRSHKISNHVTLSAPLFQGTTVFGAVTITGPEERWGLDKAAEYAPQLQSHAETISSVVTGGRIFVYQDAKAD